MNADFDDPSSLQQTLQLARRGLEPTEGARARVRLGLEQGLVAAAAKSGPLGLSLSKLRVGVAALGLGAAGFAAGWLSRGLSDAPPQPQSAVAAPQAPQGATRLEPTLAGKAPGAAPVLSPDEGRSPGEPPSAARLPGAPPVQPFAFAKPAGQSRAQSAKAPSARAPAPAGSDDAPREGARAIERETPSNAGAPAHNELSLLRRADRALRRGSPRVAMALLGDIDPSSARLGQERSALRLIAGCQLQSTGSKVEATHWLQSYPESLYRKRVESACRMHGGGDPRTPTRIEEAESQ